jgi:hypothetical protein
MLLTFALSDVMTPTMTNFELVKTMYPQFDTDSGVPDAAELSESSDDDSVKQEKYRTKEDIDVAVFVALAKQLPLKSLLHLLQGHSRAKNLGNLPTQFSAQDTVRERSMSTPSSAKRSKPIPKIKKFRFAEVSGDKVRTVVREVTSYKDIKSLWCTEHEMLAIRKDAIQTVHYFRRNRGEYCKSIEIVAQGHQDGSEVGESVVENHMKKLTEDSVARGLESHIVSLLSSRRRETVQAVLQEQAECKNCNDSYDISCQCLREQSLAYSEMSRNFASKIAQCDQIDALKASLSTWQPDGVDL